MICQLRSGRCRPAIAAAAAAADLECVAEQPSAAFESPRPPGSWPDPPQAASSSGSLEPRARRPARLRFASVSLSNLHERPDDGPAAEGEGLGFQWRPWKGFRWQLRIPFFEDADWEEEKTALNHVYAGTMARTLSQVIAHPIDTVKTRMQIKDPPKKLRKWRKKISKKAIEIGPVDIDNWFFKGPADIYRGVVGAIVGTVPNALLYFVAYEVAKRKLEKWNCSPGLTHVGSASIGTVVASIVRVPADTLKHRVQAYMHANVFEAFKTVVASEGVGGLYRGLLPTLMRDVPEIALQFGVYERMRALVARRRKVEKLTTPEHLVLGAFAGAVAATCTMPLDLVKTRQQCGVSMAIPRIFKEVIGERGVTGLFSGLGPRAFHVSLMSAFFFGLFEYCKLVLKPHRTGSDKLYVPKIWNKRRDKIWKRQFVYTE
eukprot:SM000232S07923  [mRNA]  locus=s232:36335:39477:- [translate_table: standard]